mmetsp:Transcript_128176/g.356665  ORF Transcript_128176/g.356665 Transcript_128176/m.356665 type:complete len:340 (-) Transcript_128176:34-1053(-)
MKLAKVVVLLLSLVGLSGIVFCAVSGKGSFRKVKRALLSEWARHGFGGPGTEMGRHGMFRDMMHEAKKCHRGCGADKACHEKCPQPWKHFEEKCQKMKPIWTCHKSCGRNHTCHEECPMPQCPRMQDLVRAALQCHGACTAGDSACHRACPKPLRGMMERCEALGKAMECHKACGFGNHTCHQTCHGAFGDFHHWHHHSHHNEHEHGHGHRHGFEFAGHDHHEHKHGHGHHDFELTGHHEHENGHGHQHGHGHHHGEHEHGFQFAHPVDGWRKETGKQEVGEKAGEKRNDEVHETASAAKDVSKVGKDEELRSEGGFSEYLQRLMGVMAQAAERAGVQV